MHLQNSNIKEAVKEEYGQAALRANTERSSCCGTGATCGTDDYRSKLKTAGFDNAAIEPTRIYRVEDTRAFLNGLGLDVDAIAPHVDGKFMSAFVRATIPDGA